MIVSLSDSSSLVLWPVGGQRGAIERDYRDSRNAHECDIMIVEHAVSICYKICKLQHLVYTEQQLLKAKYSFVHLIQVYN